MIPGQHQDDTWLASGGRREDDTGMAQGLHQYLLLRHATKVCHLGSPDHAVVEFTNLKIVHFSETVHATTQNRESKLG
jgi:hypothetical protein